MVIQRVHRVNALKINTLVQTPYVAITKHSNTTYQLLHKEH